jgi:3-deoxy-7-phosphoheptulonate synthase
MIDPSHGTGWSDFVPSMVKAAIVAGADSVMVEVHPNPKKALSDGPQSLNPDQFDALMQEIKPLQKIMGREQPLAVV